MKSRAHGLAAAALVLATMLPLAACKVDVRKDERGKNADVDIRTPVGRVSVHTDDKAPNTGLAVYPGARPLSDRDDPKSADVNISTSLFGVQVRAAKFESEDTPDKVLGFYRTEMRNFGEVTECKGDVDFKGPRGEQRPVCREKLLSHDVQLLTGSKDRQRVVVVKPRGSGSEFSLVYVETHGDS